MSSRFDEVIDRTGTHSLKYDLKKALGKPEDVLPMWVADMDFQAPETVRQALAKAAAHGIFGYSATDQDYDEAVCQWISRHFGWDIRPEWLVKTPGIVFAIALAIRAFTKDGEGVLIQQPVYYPFGDKIRENGRRVVNSPLVFRNGRYEMDYEDLERKIRDEGIRLMIFCSPHNPVGRVWSIEELEKLARLCEYYNVLIVSDEIHCDFTYPGVKHHMLASLSDSWAERTITCTAPSKTFNLAGLQGSNLIIPNEKLRKAMTDELSRTGYGMLNQMAIIACETAYRTGDDWVEELRGYLKDNLDHLTSFIEEKIPEIQVIRPEGTYLVWLDFRKMGMDAKQLEEFFDKEAKIWLDNGKMFGDEGEGFARINIACPRATLEEALERLEKAVSAKRP